VKIGEMLNVGALQLVSIWFRSFDYWEFTV